MGIDRGAGVRRTAPVPTVTLPIPASETVEETRAKPVVSVVIPCLNGADRLPETLAAIAAQRIEGAVEVVVVDDGSVDRTSECATHATMPWSPVRLCAHPRTRGRAAARNTGIAAARASLVVIIDDDMTLDANALEAHRAFHAAHSLRVAIGRVIQHGTPSRDCFTRFLEREEANRARLLAERPDDVSFRLCLTGHLSAPREVFSMVGGFDERITLYGLEDIELAYRLSLRGVRIAYRPEAVSRHRAFMTGLDRYLDRHLAVGRVARQLADKYDAGPFREYLRVDGPMPLEGTRGTAGLRALRAANRMLLNRGVRRALGSRPGMAVLRGALRAAEAFGLEKLAHFGYHVARDVRYFQGYFGERDVARAFHETSW